MANNIPRVIRHKERKPSKDKEKLVETERFISADEFLKEFSFSIEAEDSKRFTNNFVDFPTLSDLKCSFSSSTLVTPFPASSTLVTPFPASSLQDLTTKSDTQIQDAPFESSNTLKLLKTKQQSLTDVSSEKTLVKKTQKKVTSKPREPQSSRRERKPETSSRPQTHSKSKSTPPSEFKVKAHTTAQKAHLFAPDDSQQSYFDTFRNLTTQHPRPPSVSVDVTVPTFEKPPGLPLDLQNGLLLSATHLNLSAQRAYAETEKEAVNQLSKLHAYKQKLKQENFKLRRDAAKLELSSLASFAVGELATVEEVLTRLRLAGAQIQKLSEALSRAQSTVRLENIYLSERDREQCEKHLRELGSAASRSLTKIRSLFCQVPDVCDKVQLIAKEREEDLKRVKQTSEKLDQFASITLSKASLQSHVRLLEENLDIIKEPEKLYTVYPNDS